jgi:hypothetical protein
MRRMCCVVVSPADSNAQLVVVISATGEAPRLVSKYRPFVPQVRAPAAAAAVLLLLLLLLLLLGTECVGGRVWFRGAIECACMCKSVVE